jgi:hypothetical protein
MTLAFNTPPGQGEQLPGKFDSPITKPSRGVSPAIHES